MLKTVLFDLDDTLLDFKASEKLALAQTLHEMGLQPTEDILSRYHEINRLQWEMLERGETTREQVLRMRFVLLFKEYEIPAEAEVAQHLYEHCLGCGHIFMPHALQTIQHLSRIYDLYLITNGTARIQKRRLQSADILPYFRDVFISQEIGFNKPDARYFEHCFAKIPHFTKEKAVIVGDSLSSDIRGGNAVGVRTCWFNPSHKSAENLAKPDFEFDNLEKLPALLLKL